jgi:hypothetical protein
MTQEQPQGVQNNSHGQGDNHLSSDERPVETAEQVADQSEIAVLADGESLEQQKAEAAESGEVAIDSTSPPVRAVANDTLKDPVAPPIKVEEPATEAEAGKIADQAAGETSQDAPDFDDEAIVKSETEQEPVEPATGEKAAPAATAATAAAATVGELPVVAVEEEDRAAGKAAATAAGSGAPPLVQESQVQRSSSAGCLQSIAAVLIGALLGAALVLALLFAINGDLDWGSETAVADLQTSVSGLNADTQSLQDNMTAMETTVEEHGEVLSIQASQLESLETQQAATGQAVEELQTTTQALVGLSDQVNETEGRVGSLEGDVSGLSEGLSGLSENVDTMAAEMTSIGEQVDQIALSTARSDRFLDGMRSLMAALDQEPSEIISPTNGLTSTETLSETAPLTETTPTTPTEALTETQPITPPVPITPTAPLTDTTPPTATVPLTATTAPTATATSPSTPAAEPTTTPVPESGGNLGGIEGFVFADLNRDGRWDRDLETGIADVAIVLMTHRQEVLQRTTTDESGKYVFADLPPGLYVVTASDPEGFASSTLNTLTVVLRGGAIAPVNFGDYEVAQ